MKKTAIALAMAIASISFTASAQAYLVNNPTNRPYWGLRVGVDISSTAGEIIDQYSNAVGLTLGGVYNIPVWQNMYFEPGLTLYFDTFGMTVIAPDARSHAVDTDASIRNIGFRVPLNLGYRFDFTDDISLSLFTGPQVNFNLSGNMHVGDYSHDLMGHGFKRVDLQWGFGGSMQFFHSYYISISGGIGMTKAYQTNLDQFRRDTVNLSLGYNF